MATAEQIKSLIRSHMSNEPERFYSIALQVAAHEARQGHGGLANEIRDLIDRAKQTQPTNISLIVPRDLAGLVISEEPTSSLARLVLNDELKQRIERIVREFRQQNKLKKHGLMHRRKILLCGPPGTGKTLTSRVLACELKQPLHIIQMDRLVTKFMGETSAKLRQIFDLIQHKPGVYLFDEFDAIGGERNMDNDVGEMRRVLNSFLQFIENDISDNLVIAATNNARLLDRALFRRFDDVLHYDLPTQTEREHLIANLLAGFHAKSFPLNKAAKSAEGLSHSEIDLACRDAIKLAILSNKTHTTYASLKELLHERHSAYSGNKG